MKNIEQIIKEKGREAFYSYYLSLGYDQKTAAVLALFTYGRYRYEELSLDDVYDALCRGDAYLPWQDLEKEDPPKRSRPVFSGIASSVRKLGSGRNLSLGKNAVSEKKTRAEKKARPEKRMSSAKSLGSASLALYDLSDESGTAGPSGSANISGSAAYSESADLSGSVLYSMPSPAYEPEACSGEESFEAFLASPGFAGPDLPDSSVTVGGSGFATDEYEPIEEKKALNTAEEPTSTFRMTTNTASAGVVLNQLRNGRRIDRSMVRIEEMLNYFRYESLLPEKDMFELSYELMDADNDRKYLYINVQGREEVKDRQNIIILLDISGSMNGNTEQTQAAIASIISKLGNGDKLSLITYSTTDTVEMEAFTINGPEDRRKALEKLLSIEINGYTYGSKGIETAYKIGKKHYIEGGNNQVILITDGDLNFGITDKGGLEELIEKKKKSRLFLSVIGTGLYNYKDEKLEVLSKHGNGVYRIVNNLADVKKSIDEEYASLVNIIAKDVKGQVEFNPEIVESYRLLGFENRTLSRQDFTDDTVISEPFGSGGYGAALYELKMKTDVAPAENGLKYSRLVTTGSQEVGTVKVRYKEPLEDVSHEIEKVIVSKEAAFTDNLRLAFVVYVCAEKLRGSDKISADDITLAKKLYSELGDPVREKNAADLYKLAGILDKSEEELGIGLPKDPFIW